MANPNASFGALAAQLRELSQFAMSELEAAEAVRNLSGFVGLLSEIASTETEGGNDNAGDGSGYRIR